MSIIVPAVLGLLIIMFIVGICLSIKTWRWHLMTLMVFVFFSGGYLFTMSMMTLKTHRSWRGEINVLIDKTKKEVSEKEGFLAEASVLQEDIRFLIEERGRIRPNCDPSNADAAAGTVTVTVKMPVPESPEPGDEEPMEEDTGEPDPDAAADQPPADQPPPPDQPVDVELNFTFYVFQQVKNAETDSLTVGKYLGVYLVTKMTPNPQDGTITFDLKAPTIRSPFMAENIKAEGPWVLYERMPLDTHDLYVHKNDDPEKINELDRPKTLEELTEEGLLISEEIFQGPTKENDYKKYVATYLNHNKKLSAISDEDKALLDLNSKNRVWVNCSVKKISKFHKFSRSDLQSIITAKMNEFKASSQPFLSEDLLPLFLDIVDGKVLTAAKLKEDSNYIELMKTVSAKKIQDIYNKIINLVTVELVVGQAIRMEINAAKDLESKKILSIIKGSEYYNRPMTGYDAGFAAMYFKYGQVVEEKRETDLQAKFYEALDAIINNPKPTLENPSLIEVTKEHKKQLTDDSKQHLNDLNYAEELNAALKAKLAQVKKQRKEAFKENNRLERLLTKYQSTVQEAVLQNLNQQNLNKNKKSTSPPTKKNKTTRNGKLTSGKLISNRK